MATGGGQHRRKLIQKKGTFSCEKCGLSTPYHSFGRKHPFATALVLLEEAYVARDPFSPTPQPLILGSHCTACNKAVCVSPSCSLFYSKRFCLDCVQSNLDEFPTEIKQEVEKEKEAQSETH